MTGPLRLWRIGLALAVIGVLMAAREPFGAVVASVGVVCACLSLLWGEDQDVG